MGRRTYFVGILVALALLATACGRAASAPAAPTLSPPVSTGSFEPTATANAAPTPFPTATPEPSPTPVPPMPSVETTPPSAPIAQQQPLTSLAARLGESAMTFLVNFTQDFSPRASATAEELAAAEFLLGQLQQLGYEAELQPFSFEMIADHERVLTLVSPEQRGIDALPMHQSGTGTVTSGLVHVGRGLPEDIPAEGLAGKIALIERGIISFEEKVSRVAQGGAVAAIVYNNQSGLFRGTLTSESSIPAVGISQQSGQELLRLLEAGPVEATVSVEFETRDSRNVIAEKPGTDPNGGVVVLGGHYDTVPDVPGANDNGSGTATLITIAREIKDRSYPFTVRLIAFGAEELGLHGSRHYVDSLPLEERQRITAMLNFDALGSGPVVGIMGNFALLPELLTLGQEGGIQVERRTSLGGGSSDFAPFQAVGIPYVFFLADDFSRIHTPEDRLEFVRPELMGGSAALALTLLGMLAAG